MYAKLYPDVDHIRCISRNIRQVCPGSDLDMVSDVLGSTEFHSILLWMWSDFVRCMWILCRMWSDVLRMWPGCGWDMWIYPLCWLRLNKTYPVLLLILFICNKKICKIYTTHMISSIQVSVLYKINKLWTRHKTCGIEKKS